MLVGPSVQEMKAKKLNESSPVRGAREGRGGGSKGDEGGRKTNIFMSNQVPQSVLHLYPVCLSAGHQSMLKCLPPSGHSRRRVLPRSFTASRLSHAACKREREWSAGGHGEAMASPSPRTPTTTAGHIPASSTRAASARASKFLVIITLHIYFNSRPTGKSALKHSPPLCTRSSPVFASHRGAPL